MERVRVLTMPVLDKLGIRQTTPGSSLIESV
jgi:hypothetical protein